MSIEEIIKNYFPDELKAPEAFEDWLSPIRENANPEAVNLLDAPEKRLTSEKATTCLTFTDSVVSRVTMLTK
ncbi:MAG: hypothetical protein WC836_00410 [Desulfobacula sp.]|jgi:hypothetical protein